MSQKAIEEKRLTAEYCTALVDELHEHPLLLTSLPKAWQREIQGLGNISRGGAEHMFFAMLTLVSYTLGCGAVVEARMSGEDIFRASSNIIITIVQASGGGKSPVVAWMFGVMRRISARIQRVFYEEDKAEALAAGNKDNVKWPPKLKNTYTL